MPVCTSCTAIVPYLYTQYASAYNLRLERCDNCHAFADPYVEHDTLIIVLDLILLKRDVFRHLIYNRGSMPRLVGTETTGNLDDAISPKRAGPPDLTVSGRSSILIFKLASAIVAVDAFIQWTRSSPLYKNQIFSGLALPLSRAMTTAPYFRFFLLSAGEMISFQLGILLAVYVFNWIRLTILSTRCGDGPAYHLTYFRASHVPMALLYASLVKFFLLFLLSVWSASDTGLQESLDGVDSYQAMWSAFDDANLDREWVIRNVLGGMAAGFGLRVALDFPPVLITVVIISGWIAKALFDRSASQLFGLVSPNSSKWAYYSIP